MVNLITSDISKIVGDIINDAAVRVSDYSFKDKVGTVS